MAGDWIKVRTSLPRDGRLLVSSRKCHAISVKDVTQVSQRRHAPVTIFGALVMMWCHADQHADEKGVMVGYTSEDIDSLVGLPGFCAALPEDWISFTDDGWVQLPDYSRHNGDSAKKRAQAANRKQSQRERDKDHAASVTGVTKESRSEGDEGHKESGTREEKRRDNTPIVPKGDILDPLLIRAKALLRIRPSTPLDSGQSTAWKKNKGGVAASSEDDWLALEWFYAQPNGRGELGEYKRTALAALLNHWSDEVSKAQAVAKKAGKHFGREKKKGPEIPDDWKTILTEADPEMHVPEHFEQLPESVRSWIIDLHRKRKKEGGEDGH